MSERQILDDVERVLLKRLAGSIIGASSKFDIPGADDERILERLLERVGTMGDQFQRLMRDFFSEYGGIVAVAASDDGEFAALIEVIQRRRHAFLATMVTLTAQAYYEDPRVLLSMNKQPRPPFPEGNVLEQGDWSLLDEVKKRSPMYRS